MTKRDGTTIPLEIVEAVYKKFRAPLTAENRNMALSYAKQELNLTQNLIIPFMNHYDDLAAALMGSSKQPPSKYIDAAYVKGSKGRKVPAARDADKQFGPTTPEEY